jgi:cytochrome c oxidase subunit IV
MKDHIVPVRTYVVIFVALIILTWVTTAIAFIDLGPFNVYVALTIAVIKATLVVLFFMHVKYSERVTKIYVAAGFFWLIIMIGMVLIDYISRTWLPINGAW